tara:strand:+ start:97 stop:480 length:384 start_codon:yes stop_codon:yes gene_type:complete
MPKIIYPEHYTDEDKAMYDDLISRGDIMIGKKLSENERFLLDLSAKITINQLKGYDSGYTDEEITNMKQAHKEMAQQGIIETPPDKFYEDIIELSDGTKFQHPLSYPSEYYYDKNKEEPKEIPVNID